MENSPKTTVYFDGHCPLCRREISFYKACRGGALIEWVDAANVGQDKLGEDLDRTEALKRLYVRDTKSRLVSGGAAFTAIWKELPAFRPLAFFFGLPAMAPLLEFFYNVFLKVRPLLHRLLLS